MSATLEQEEIKMRERKTEVKTKGMETTDDAWGGGREESLQLHTFEDLLEVVGSKGRWNHLIFLMCSFVAFVSALLMLTYEFLGATPDHWCLVPQLQAANWSQHQVLSLAIPHSNKTDDHENCKMYDYNYTEVVEMGYEAAMANRPSLTTESESPVLCEARDFNYSQYQSTVVTEWDLVCERRTLYSTTQAVVMAGKMVGTVLFGWIVDVWGRRLVVLVTGVFYCLGSFLIIASPSIEVYILVRGLVSVMDSGIYLALFVFLMENCVTRYRAAVGTLFAIPWALGYMAVPVIAYLIRPWRWLQFAYAVPTFFFCVYFVWLPESPRWLIIQSRFPEALKVLTWAAKVNKRTLPPDDVILATMADIEKQAERHASREEGEEQNGWCGRVTEVLKQFVILLLIPQLRLRTLVIFFCWFSASMVYYGVALNSGNLGTDPYLYVFLGGLLEVPSYLLLWWAMVLMGRQKSLVVLYLLGAVCIFSVMTIMLVQRNGSEVAVVVLSQAGKVAVTAAFQLVWAYTAELYPTKYRSLAVGEANFFSRMGSLFSPYVNDLLGMAAVWAPSALFGSVSLISAALTITLPETRHADLQESVTLHTMGEGTEEEGRGQEGEGWRERRNEATACGIIRGSDNPAFTSMSREN